MFVTDASLFGNWYLDLRRVTEAYKVSDSHAYQSVLPSSLINIFAVIETSTSLTAFLCAKLANMLLRLTYHIPQHLNRLILSQHEAYSFHLACSKYRCWCQRMCMRQGQQARRILRLLRCRNFLRVH